VIKTENHRRVYGESDPFGDFDNGFEKRTETDATAQVPAPDHIFTLVHQGHFIVAEMDPADVELPPSPEKVIIGADLPLLPASPVYSVSAARRSLSN
jgi:hypothetical protein